MEQNLIVFSSFHDDGEIGRQRSKGSNGSKNRCQYGADHTDGHRDLKVSFPLFIFDDDLPDIPFMDQFFYL